MNDLSKNLLVTPPVRTTAEAWPSSVPRGRAGAPYERGPDFRGQTPGMSPAEVYERINAGCAPKGVLDRTVRTRADVDREAVRRATTKAAAQPGTSKDMAEVLAAIARLEKLLLAQDVRIATLEGGYTGDAA